MRKSISALLTAAILLVSIAGCVPEESETDPINVDKTSESVETTEIIENTSEVPLDTLIVGTSDMTGDFLSGFGTNSYDLGIKTLTNGFFSTYETTSGGEIILNETVVSNVETALDDVGNKTYTFTLHDDLFWNNGDQITALDYVARLLWTYSNEWTEAGAAITTSNAIIGESEYFDGTTDYFKGVSLISDLEFSLTISAENLPYFWETVYVTAGPIHFDTYLPSCEIISDENGSKLSFTEGDLLTNAQRIASTERYAPTVTCGPYKFVSFENGSVTLEKNDYFKGDYNGNTPSFEYVIQKTIPVETDVEWVINGQVDIVQGVIGAEKIESAKSSENALLQEYLRAGYGYLAMLCDAGPTSDVNVRWALASLIDRNAVVDYVLGGYGTTVNSEYGVGQWMYQERGADLQEELLPISFNIDTANDYLDESEWTFEADGTTPFDNTKALPDGSYLRHNADGEKLVINHLGQANVFTDIIEIQYAANAPLAGIEFNITHSDWNSVQENYHNAYSIPAEERVYNTFNLASNFTSIFDRYYSIHSDFVGTRLNSSQLSDPILDDAIIAMRSTDPNDKEGYLDAWVDYQIRWNQLLPQVPMYSNENFDVYHKNVDNLNTTAYAKYQDIICEITKTVK